jgi:ATP-dependent protease ClpP protease subunit
VRRAWLRGNFTEAESMIRVSDCGKGALVVITGRLSTDAELQLAISQLTQFETAELFVNSEGGCAFAARSLVAALEGKVKVARVRNASSAAAFIALAAPRVLIYPNGAFMFHGPRRSTENFETLEDVLKAGDEMKQLVEDWVQFVVKRTNASEETVRDWFRKGDHWFNASKAIELGLAHEVIEPREKERAASLEKFGASSSSSAPIRIEEAETDETADFFLKFVVAFGSFKVRDFARFFRNVITLLQQNVRSLPK